jgi:hypothetical protein
MKKRRISFNEHAQRTPVAGVHTNFGFTLNRYVEKFSYQLVPQIGGIDFRKNKRKWIVSINLESVI